MIDVKLINYKTFSGHDGMRGINADIVYKGNKIAHVYDDAYGGEFQYDEFGKVVKDGNGDYKQDAQLKANKILFKELMAEVKALPKKYHKGLDFECGQTIDGLISNLCSKLDQKKDEKKGILIKSNYGYDIIGYSVTIPTIIKKYHDGLESIQKIYDKNKDKEILNTEYLKSIGIKL